MEKLHLAPDDAAAAPKVQSNDEAFPGLEDGPAPTQAAEREKSLKNKERFSKSTTGIGSHSGSHIEYSSGISSFFANTMIRTR